MVHLPTDEKVGDRIIGWVVVLSCQLVIYQVPLINSIGHMTHPSLLYLGKSRVASFVHGWPITKKHIFFSRMEHCFFFGREGRRTDFY